ncbi:hypothetical protein [Pseudonocardia sp. KRD291]|uniref:hypothetical protein n=1 Tax=Pseudonocardia sp. KRD291 TaxID=2792007 RepID=UPI001C4A26CD|nr:hypothetical protein [Pseudonocardia sp. KRD291]MBW0102341.1 hypothetical protein [Pseudonocardia sp. KRD291]
MVLSACGGSVADRGSSRTVTTTQAQAVSPFCEAVENSRSSARPVTELGTGRRVDDIAGVADRVRAANEQVTALSPQELRADFERVNALVERQLRQLETNGGDTFALARDPDVAREASDPAYTAASGRINDYVRSTC